MTDPFPSKDKLAHELYGAIKYTPGKIISIHRELANRILTALRAENEPPAEPVAYMRVLDGRLIRAENGYVPVPIDHFVPLYRHAPPPSSEDVRDAERYRWLRKGNDYERIGPMVVLCEADHRKNDHRPFWSLAESALDAAVDKARATATKAVEYQCTCGAPNGRHVNWCQQAGLPIPDTVSEPLSPEAVKIHMQANVRLATENAELRRQILALTREA